ncbi:hypothetical protein LTR47_000339 [Exophiala xenobiotica]|nr:hypothetical protein LTR41_004118 [Exophiala xenobiotica]KAK5238596.1 hypothetical protein LTR47_000339 [Exophiala xenobiotica]KAK5246236.1 hypothetical protein LTS06_008471 [Exophiala xenobiotica]KAK5259122.1 hypothetical protein LTR40_006577 [Exophiala xenobiotica]KAK5325491.1 hypothetical protein LTR93_003711 [Exophiala xenobiotica]
MLFALLLLQTLGPATTIFITPTPTVFNTPTPSALTSTHENHTGAIAGGVVGGVAELAMVVLVAVFFWRRRRKSRAPVEEPSIVTEKAQLHSDDVKPDRKELQGTEGSRDMLEKQPKEVAEMAANEEVVADNLKELPSNETPGHELETTENEMAALDRLARMTDSTTLVHASSKSDDSPKA